MTWPSVSISRVTLSALSTMTGISRPKCSAMVATISNPALTRAAWFAVEYGTMAPSSLGTKTSQHSLRPPLTWSTNSWKDTLRNLLLMRSVRALTFFFVKTSHR